MKRYDRAYFDRWYRARGSRITSPADLERRVRMVVGIAEHLLQRPLRTTLDVGCGEGAWQPVLRRLRPALRYQGVDSSPYAVRRFGRRRNVREGSFAQLEASAWAAPFDLIVCVDVVHYLSAAELRSGLPQLRELAGGVVYLAAFTSTDDPAGDLRDWYRRSAGWYRELFRRHGLVSVGMQCYVPVELEERAAALEVAGAR